MQKTKYMKKRIFEIIQIGNRSDVPSLLFDLFIIAVIVVNISITFFMTFDQSIPFMPTLKIAECVTIVIFLVEYILRIWTAEFLYPKLSRPQAKWKFIISFFGLIDLFTILPYFLPLLFPNGAVAFRMLRVVRMLHLFRINANYDAFNVITDVLQDKKDQIFSSVFLIIVLMLASSLCMYGLEHEAQPENFENAFSGIWWSVSTLLTVGYGDIYPVTIGGQLMAIVIAFLGVGMVAIPTGIISAGFVEYYTRVKTVNDIKLDADFMTLQMKEGHPFVGKKVNEIMLTEGMKVAALISGNQVITDMDEVPVRKEDYLLLVSDTQKRMDAHLDEVVLTTGHIWVGKTLSELDISRRQFVLLVQRGKLQLQPEEELMLEEGDSIILLDRRGISGKRSS